MQHSAYISLPFIHLASFNLYPRHGNSEFVTTRSLITRNVRVSELTVIKNFPFDFLFSQCIGHISQAHINPAITVGAVVLGKKTIPEGLVYIISQLIGAILGYGMLKVSIRKLYPFLFFY